MLLPNLLLFVDDNSSDNTCSIIKDYMQSFSWIKLSTFKDEKADDFPMHFSRVRSFTVDTLIEVCRLENVEYDFVGILDADMHLENDFYAKMTDELNKDNQLGIVSAMIFEPLDENLYYQKKSRIDQPGGATLMFRKQCLIDIGGVPSNMYPEDTIMNALADLRNWKSRRLKKVTAIQRRRTSSARGIKKGFIYEGEKVYFLRYNLIYVIIRALYISFFMHPKGGVYFIFGYTGKIFKSGKKLEDPDLIAYFKRERYKRIIAYRLKELFRFSRSSKSTCDPKDQGKDTFVS